MFKPLLAAAADLSSLRFPYLATPKIDGIRCLITADGAVSRNMKPIPNRYIRETIAKSRLVGLDGELLTYTNGVRDDFNTAQGNIMRADGEPVFRFLAFDRFNLGDMPYRLRVEDFMTFYGHHIVIPLIPVELPDMAALDAYERQMVDQEGWEGIMLRRPGGPYKHGRSTAKEGILLKVKRFTDDEAVITGLVEQNENTNEATRNVFGRTERSSAKAGMVGKGTLGALQCRWKGVDFQVGTGMTQAVRDDLWAQGGSLVGQRVTFKYQGVGTNGAPRFPVFKGIRQD